MNVLYILGMILLFFIVLYIGLAILGWLLSSTGMGETQHDAKKSRSVAAGKGGDYNYTCSIWVYVKDWQYNYGSTKTILSKGGGSPSITLGASDNSLSVSVGHTGSKEGFSDHHSPKPLQSKVDYDKTKSSSHKPLPVHGTSTSGAQQVYHCGAAKPPAQHGGSGGTSSSASCVIPNFPLQTWVNIVVSVYGKTVDVYINGKLQKSCRLPGVASPSQGSMSVTPNGGFSGYTAKAEYWPSASNSEQAYMIYLSGPGVATGSTSNGDSSGTYRVKVSFLENGKDEGSFEF